MARKRNKKRKAEERDNGNGMTSTTTTSTSSQTNDHGNETENDKTSGLDEIDEILNRASSKRKAEKQKGPPSSMPMSMSMSSKKATHTTSSRPKSKSHAPNHNSKNKKLSYDRTDTLSVAKGEWVDDGLGGVFNHEGFTGRTDTASGHRIFKAHLFRHENAGYTKDCPFDCKCCYI